MSKELPVMDLIQKAIETQEAHQSMKRFNISFFWRCLWGPSTKFGRIRHLEIKRHQELIHVLNESLHKGQGVESNPRYWIEHCDLLILNNESRSHLFNGAIAALALLTALSLAPGIPNMIAITPIFTVPFFFAKFNLAAYSMHLNQIRYLLEKIDKSAYRKNFTPDCTYTQQNAQADAG
jgi:hypothetical protein